MISTVPDLLPQVLIMVEEGRLRKVLETLAEDLHTNRSHNTNMSAVLSNAEYLSLLLGGGVCTFNTLASRYTWELFR